MNFFQSYGIASIFVGLMVLLRLCLLLGAIPISAGALFIIYCMFYRRFLEYETQIGRTCFYWTGPDLAALHVHTILVDYVAIGPQRQDTYQTCTYMFTLYIIEGH